MAGESIKPIQQKTLSLRKYELKWGFFFISPWIIGFLLFNIIPMVASFLFTFLDYNLATPDQTRFIGLANWKRMLFEDPEVLYSILRVFLFGLIQVPISLLFCFLLAIIMNSRHLLGKNLFRTLFYMPTIIPIIAVTFIWRGVLNDHDGWLNMILFKILPLEALGIKTIRWLHDPKIIYLTYTFIGLWGVGNGMLIFLAGLQRIPTQLYEAAIVDGAGSWKRLIHITIPMISPIFFYNLIISVILLVQYFFVPYVINTASDLPAGYPDGWSNFVMVYFFKNAFSYFNMGYGSVIAWVMFMITLLLTFILFKSSRNWVYYEG
ncbi:MAG: sugar ABC transporter permease [Spirochaetes bacterium]|nr:sugar ABC transporter permease [Spirochaetota bacterium]